MDGPRAGGQPQAVVAARARHPPCARNPGAPPPSSHPRLETHLPDQRAHRTVRRSAGRRLPLRPLGRCGRRGHGNQHSTPTDQRRPRCPAARRTPRARRRRCRQSGPLSPPSRGSRVRRHCRRRRPERRRRPRQAPQPGRPAERRRAGEGRLRQDHLRNSRRAHQPQHRDSRRAGGDTRLQRSLRPGCDRLPDQLRRLPEHPRAGRHPRHERGRICRRPSLPDPVTRFPALVIATTWCFALAAAVVLAPDQPTLGILAIALAIPCLALALVLRPAILTVALAFALLAVGRAELPPPDPGTSSRATALIGRIATITGRVADDPRPPSGGGEVLVEPATIVIGATPVTGIGDLMVRWRSPTQPAFGDQVQATGKLVLPRDLPNFDRRAYLAQRHVYVELQSTSFDVTSDGTGFARFPAWVRARYTSALDAALPPPHAAVLLGVVLGIRQGIPPGLQNALIATGLVHLLVLSGLKVAVFARIVQGSLKPVLGQLATWPAVGLIAVYAMVGGATPAAVRAAAMGALAIGASRLGRPTHVWTSLALTAAAMLGWHPELAWGGGFQLSFAGTAAIILLTPSIEGRLRFMPKVLREPFAVTCAAQVGTLPMMATDFHVVSPVAPIANALVIPILPALVSCGLLLGALSIQPEIARLAAIPITGLLAYLEQVAYLLARIPAAVVPIPRFPTWAGLAYYSALGPGIAAGHASGRNRRVAAITAVLAPTLIAATALGMWANAPPQAIVMAIGDGQAVLFRGPHGAILIDGGPSPARLKDELGAQLPPWQTTLDAMAIPAPTLGHD